MAGWCAGACCAGEGLRSCELSLQDLKEKFKSHTVSATLQCTGNRRHEVKEVRYCRCSALVNNVAHLSGTDWFDWIGQVREVQGLDWDVGAIGNASFTGVRLADVLKVLLTVKAVRMCCVIGSY